MPDEERGAIGMVKPTGWHTVKYENVDGRYLYNRCHLIGYQLTGENANKKNLITGTRYLNVTEAESVKDQKISFHVFVYNIQPGIEIDYTTGNSWEE